MATVKIQMRRDTAANWASENPTLSSGEIALETDTLIEKMGDGTTAYNNLKPRISPISRNRSTEIELIGHRGLAGSYPGNTMLSFSASLESGVDSWECDVQPSATGKLYMFHDATVDATTNGTGTFTALSNATIDALVLDEVAGTEYAGEGVATFEDFLTLAKEKNIYIYPEVKAKLSDTTIDDIVQAVEDAGMEDKCTITSFNLTDLARVRVTNSKVGVAISGISTSSVDYEAAIDAVASYGRGEILWLYSALLSTPAIVTYAQAAGVRVVAWTVPDDQAARDLKEIGVTQLIADIPLGGNRGGVPVQSSRVEDFYESQSGSGAFSYADGVANIVDPDDSSRAYLGKSISVKPGEIVTLSCRARLISGSGETAPALGLDYPYSTQMVNKIHFNSTSWKDYSISCTVPQTHEDNTTDYVNCLAGSWTALIGEVDITNLRVEVKNSGLAVPRIFALGLLQIISGTPTFNANHARTGISALSYNAGAKKLTITCEASGPNNIRNAPVFFLNTLNGTGIDLVPKWGSYNRQTGTVEVQFIDMSLATPAAVDITGLGTIYLSVMGLG